MGCLKIEVESDYFIRGIEFARETAHVQNFTDSPYDPSIGRFLQVDPDPGKMISVITVVNKYAYGASNPIINVDPSGKFFWMLLAISAGVGAISGGLWAAATGQNILAGIASGAFSGLLSGLGVAGGLAIAGAIAGTSAAAAIGTTLGSVLAGLGSGTVGAVLGAVNNPQNPGAGALTGFVFGFIGGAIAGSGLLKIGADATQGTILNAPPVDIPKSVPPPTVPRYSPLPPQGPVPIGNPG